MRILIAEDDRITRRSLQWQLEKWGHSVVDSKDGAEAWEQFQGEQFDVVVTDWEMPRMDGQQLIERIRECGQSHYTYVIMLTGRSEKNDLVTGIEAGADDFLAKPFDREELRVRLHAGERIIQLERRLAAQNEKLQKANKRMKRDLDAAAEMQRELLPGSSPQVLGANFAWHYEPCDELGGDILNVIPLNGQSVGMYLLDVSGHGVPAALLSVTLSRVLNAQDEASSILIEQERGKDRVTARAPRDVAARLNSQFRMRPERTQYFTMIYAVLDSGTNVLHYILAGHPAPILLRKGSEPQELPGGNLPVGLVPNAVFEDCQFQLEPGDRLFFFSDGITEAFNRDRDQLGKEGLIQFLEHTSECALNESLVACIDEFKRWCDPVPLADDISILALELPS